MSGEYFNENKSHVLRRYNLKVRHCPHPKFAFSNDRNVNIIKTWFGINNIHTVKCAHIDLQLFA